MQELLNITARGIQYRSQILDVRLTSLPHICEHEGAKISNAERVQEQRKQGRAKNDE